MADPDFYTELGIARGASPDEVRSAYRRLARKYHPDVNPGDTEAEERFKSLSHAYAVLSDEAKRARYDEFGTQGLEPGFDPNAARQWRSRGGRHPFEGAFGGGGVNLEDLFGGFGSAGPFARGAVPVAGRDRSSRLDVDFLDAALARDIRVTTSDGESLRIHLPPGARNGTRVRLARKGEPGARGGPPGDLFLVLRVRTHARFRRRGDDLEVEVPITVPEWIRGGSIEVPTPEGQAQLQVPPRASIDKRLRMRGKGAVKRGGERGHLLVSLVPVLPETADAEHLETLAAELESLYGDQETPPDNSS